MHPAWGLLIAYVAGSLPSALIAGKLARGIDLRQHGSGNLGATNAVRVLGWKIGIWVYIADLLKGALPVLYLPRLFPSELPDRWALAYGVAAIAGHVWPVFLGFRSGGKGVATAGGVFAALSPLALVASAVVWVVVVYASGYVSLASLAAAAILPVGVALTRGVSSPLFIVSALIAMFVFWTHRANIARLRQGEESRFGGKSTP